MLCAIRVSKTNCSFDKIHKLYACLLLTDEKPISKVDTNNTFSVDCQVQNKIPSRRVGKAKRGAGGGFKGNHGFNELSFQREFLMNSLFDAETC